MWAELALEAQTPVGFLEEGVWTGRRGAQRQQVKRFGLSGGKKGRGWRDQGLSRGRGRTSKVSNSAPGWSVLKGLGEGAASCYNGYFGA